MGTLGGVSSPQVGLQAPLEDLRREKRAKSSQITRDRPMGPTSGRPWLEIGVNYEVCFRVKTPERRQRSGTGLHGLLPQEARFGP